VNDLEGATLWLHAHAAALAAALGDVIANHPEPAGTVVIRTLGTVVVAWVIFKIVKKVGK
jgi:hypothetical protein